MLVFGNGTGFRSIGFSSLFTSLLVCCFAKRLPSHMLHCASFYQLEEPNWLCLENWEYDHGNISYVISKEEGMIFGNKGY
jgi:hypothetical protein